LSYLRAHPVRSAWIHKPITVALTMSDTATQPPPSRAACGLLLLTALAQGILLTLTLAGEKVWLERFLSANGLLYVLALALTLPTVLALTLTRLNEPRLWQHVAALTCVQCVMIAWANWNTAAPHVDKTPIWLPLAAGVALGLFVALPWLQGRQRHGHWRIPYADLFELAWHNALCLLLALIFTGIGWAILMLGAELFALVDITVFRELVRSEPFVRPASSVLFMLGMLIARSQHKPVQMLRQILFALCKGLLPVVAAIAVLFAASLLFTGLEPLWQTGHAAGILTLLIALLVLLTNAVWQDGHAGASRPAPYARFLRWLVELGLLILPVYATLTLVALGLRIDQYSWTVGRVFGVLVALLASGYALGYAAAVLRGWPKRAETSGWLAPIAPVNQALSWTIILLAVLVNTPVLDAYRISAASQVARLRADMTLLDGEVLRYLRFGNGRRGYEALQALRDDPAMASTPATVWDSSRNENVPAMALAVIDDMLARSSRWQSADANNIRALHITDVAALRTHIALADGSTTPDDAWWQQLAQGQLQPIACLSPASLCVARLAELDNHNTSGVPDVLLCHIAIPGQVGQGRANTSGHANCAIHGISERDGTWRTHGRVSFYWDETHTAGDPTLDLKAALLRAPLRTQPQRWPFLTLGNSEPIEVRGVYTHDR